MQNVECRIKENARAFWIVKLRKRLISNRKTVFNSAKLYVCNTKQNNVECRMQNAELRKTPGRFGL